VANIAYDQRKQVVICMKIAFKNIVFLLKLFINWTGRCQRVGILELWTSYRV